MKISQCEAPGVGGARPASGGGGAVWSCALALALVLVAPPAGAQVERGAQPRSLAELEAAFEATAGGSLEAQAAALNALTAHRTAECVRVLDRIRRTHGSALIRQLALRAIGQVGVAPAPAIIEAVLDSGGDGERSAALWALSALEPPAPARRFLDALAPQGPDAVRLIAFRALGAYPQAEVADALVGAIQLPDRLISVRLRDEAAAALRRLVAAPPLAAWLVEGPLGERPAPAAALPHLLRAASGGAEGQVGGAVLRLLARPEAAVRAEAALAAGELWEGRGASAREALDALAPLLDEQAQPEKVLVAAGAAVAQIGPAGAALERLLTLARSRQAGRRVLALRALGRATDDPRVLAAARAALSDEAEPVRLAAVAALGGLGDKAQVDALVVALRRAGSARLQAAITHALRVRTGADLGDRHRDWHAWWSAVKADYVLPAAGERAAADADGDARPERAEEDAAADARRTRVRPRYYGIELESDRVAFVVDVSGSMHATMRAGGSTVPLSRLEVLERELREAIDALAPGAVFNVVSFSDGFQAWRPAAARAGPREKRSALAFVADLTAAGGTNMFDPLAAVLKDPELDTVWLMSDGEPNAGRLLHPHDVLREVRRLNATRGVAIHTIAVGLQSDLLRRLADEHGGTYHER